MVTLQEIKQKHQGKNPKKVLSRQDIELNQRVQQETQGNQFARQEPKNFLEKTRDVVIGGGELARGLGLSIAAPFVNRELSEAQSTSSDVALQLQKEIAKNRQQGRPTENLERAYKDLTASQEITRDTREDFVENLPSNKQVIGSAARLAALTGGGALAGGVTRTGTARLGASGGRVGGLAQLTGASTAQRGLSGLTRGAATGVGAGGIEGAVQGAGFAAEQDMSTEEILMSGALGAVGGGVGGGVLGGVAGGISGGRAGSRIAKEEFASRLAQPKDTAKVRAEAISRGLFDDPKLFERAQLQVSKRDKELGDAIDDVVSRNAPLSENVNAIDAKIKQTNAGVRNYIENNKVPFNTSQLRKRLEGGKDELELVFASDTTAENTYDKIVDAFMREVDKKDTLGLFRARQKFDQIPAVKKLLDSSALGENTRREVVLTARKKANEYVADLLPKGNQYRDELRRESLMIEALGNLADKSASIIGKNKIQLLNEEYPMLKWIVGGAAGAGLFGGGVGAGGALIGSTD